MYRESEGEEFPDDVKPQPICFRHWLFQRSLEVTPKPLILTFTLVVYWAVGVSDEFLVAAFLIGMLLLVLGE